MSRVKEIIKRGIRFVIKGQPIKYTTANIVITASSELLKGKKVMITGGSKGIGYAMAKKLVEEGAKVIITGRDLKSLEKASRDLNCQSIVMDITKISELTSSFQQAEEQMGGIDCLINNAGVSLHEYSFEEVSVDGFDKQFNTNFKGAYFLTQCFVKAIKKKSIKNAKIIFISSQRGTFVDDIPYGLTKATINSLVQGLAYDLISDDIRVYGLAPGATVTDLIGFETNGNLHYNINRSKRLYLPEEVAEVACFLLSDIANCLSGNILVCDEGRSINTYKKQ